MQGEKIDSRDKEPASVINKMINKGNRLNDGKIDFRINKSTIIKVLPEQATEEYRKQFIKKYKLSRDI